METVVLEARREIAYFTRRMYETRLTSSSGGNVSRRIDSEHIGITPAHLDKARITEDQIATVSMDGQRITGPGPCSELSMHLEIYRSCPAVDAIIHAHPLVCTAFTCARTAIRRDLLAETYALIDEPIVAPYALSGTRELAMVVASCAQRSSCILLQSHAVLTTGTTVFQAFSRLEILESAACTTLIARLLEGVQPLAESQKAALDKLIGRI